MGVIIFDENIKALKKIEKELKKESLSVLVYSDFIKFIFMLGIFRHSVIILSQKELTERNIEIPFIMQKYRTANVILTYTYFEKNIAEVQVHYIGDYQIRKSKKETDDILKTINGFDRLLNKTRYKNKRRIFSYSLKNLSHATEFKPYRNKRINKIKGI